MTRPAPYDGAAQRLFPLAAQLFGGRLRRLVRQPNEPGLARDWYRPGEVR